MASGLAETAKLVASLELKDRFTPAANKAMASLGKLEGRAFRVGQNIGKGFQNAAANIAKLGVVVGAGLALAVRGGIGHLAELEDATTSVDGAIKQMGLTGAVTSAQVATWANEIESNVGAAFDDKAIVAATSTLLRFGKVTPSNLRPAMQVITDLAVKTGSVDSAATLLAKALADPTKAAGKLARSGVILTKVQQDQIKAFVKAGKTAQAQKVILDALAKTTAGAAAASQGPYRRALSVLADVTEDAQKALAVGFLPVLEKVAKLLSSELAKPGTLDNIRKFGEGLAGGLDKVIDIARSLPWATIGTSLKLAGEGAKTILNAFLGLPPWIQTAVLTGWGLNKLTGGALGGIAKELGGIVFDQFKGRGATPANPLFVSQVGGIPGGGAVPVAGGLTGLQKVFLVGEAIGLALLVNEVKNGVTEAGKVQAEAVRTEAAKWLSQQPTKADLERGLAGVEQGIRDIESDPIAAEFINKPALLELRGLRKDIATQIANLTPGKDQRAISDPKPADFLTPERLRDTFDRAAAQPIVGSIETFAGKARDDLITVNASTINAGSLTSAAARAAGQASAAATYVTGFGIMAAIRASQPRITVNNSISSTGITKTNTVVERYGNPSGDRDGNVGVQGR